MKILKIKKSYLIHKTLVIIKIWRRFSSMQFWKNIQVHAKDIEKRKKKKHTVIDNVNFGLEKKKSCAHLCIYSPKCLINIDLCVVKENIHLILNLKLAHILVYVIPRTSLLVNGQSSASNRTSQREITVKRTWFGGPSLLNKYMLCSLVMRQLNKKQGKKKKKEQ